MSLQAHSVHQQRGEQDTPNSHLRDTIRDQSRFSLPAKSFPLFAVISPCNKGLLLRMLAFPRAHRASLGFLLVSCFSCFLLLLYRETWKFTWKYVEVHVRVQERSPARTGRFVSLVRGGAAEVVDRRLTLWRSVRGSSAGGEEASPVSVYVEVQHRVHATSVCTWKINSSSS